MATVNDRVRRGRPPRKTTTPKAKSSESALPPSEDSPETSEDTGNYAQEATVEVPAQTVKELTVEVPLSYLQEVAEFTNEVQANANGIEESVNSANKNSNSNRSSNQSRTQTNKQDTMTQSNNSNQSSNNSNQTNEYTKREVAKEKRKKMDDKLTSIIDLVAYYTSLALSLPFRVAASLAETFVEVGLPGTRLIGASLFLGSVAYTADSYWQASGNNPIFPFFNDNFTGWSFLFIFSPFFWGLFLLCLGFQYLQAETLRGMTASEAKRRTEEMSAYEATDAPKGKIKIASIYHKKYMNAGIRHNNFRSLFSLATLVLDAIVIFSSRNPYDWADKIFLGFWVIVIVNIVQLGVGEGGYILWKSSK